MNLNKLYLTKNDCYKAGVTFTPKGVMVHSTGCNNPYLKRYVGPDDGKLGVNIYGNHWNQPKPDGISKCVHAFIGRLADGSIATYQTLPWNMRGWHGGASVANNSYIGFEICEDGLTDKAYFDKVYREAAELTAYLCAEYNLDPRKDGVVICHCEGYKRGIASNHSDVLNWFPKFGKSMDTFRADVAALMVAKGDEEDEMNRYNTVDELPAYAKPTIQKLMNKGLLAGNAKGLDLSEDMIRIFVINDRAGAYD